MHKFIAFMTVSLILLLPACGEKLTALKTSNVDHVFPPKTAKPQNSAEQAPPAAVTDALIPDFNQTLLTDSPAEKPVIFNISVHDADARDFFMGLVADSQENMVVHPDVAGRISLELKNVTIAQVLSTVQKVYGYDYTKTDIGYIIYPATLQTKIFKIDRLDLMREGSSNTRVSSGQINSGGRNSNANNTSVQPSVPGAANPNNPNSTAANNSTSGSWITTSSKTDFWDEMQKSLAAIVDASPVGTNEDELHNPQTGSKVVINKQTGIVVVRANPTQMREVENLIVSTQGQIGRQVAIEAKILEVVLSDNHQDGINWGNVMRNAKFGLLSAVNPLPIAATVASQAFSIGIKSGDFYAFIELLEGQGKTNILSSPRISTLNNQKAVIKVGKDQYFITGIASNNSLSAATNTVTQDITWTPFFSGISLDVTPQIADNNHITLHIHPSVTLVTEDVKVFQINNQPNSIPMALNTVRESDSIVNAESGQIIVIGGLMKVDIEENKQGVSILSEIPYLGNLFRQNSGTGQKSELVILLKPTVINSGEDWNGPIENSREHLHQLERKQMWK